MSKIITVTGNFGKTTFSYFLASLLSKASERIMLIDTNMIHPNMGYVLPIEKKSTKSLGRLLSLAVIDPKSVFDNMQSLNNENIGIICYANGESRNNYPQIQQASIQALLDVLGGIADTIIVVGQTEENAIDLFVKEKAATRICITSADLKGLAYREQHSDTEVTHVLIKTSKYNPYEDILHTFKEHVKYELPFCDSLSMLYNGGLLDDVICPSKYDKVLLRLKKEVLSDV